MKIHHLNCATLCPVGRSLLGQGGVMTTHALPTSSSPIHRGKLVRERPLCQDMPPPPPSLDTSPLEKMYVVLAGEVTISNGTETITLGAWDSCRIAPGEPRALANRTNQPATVLLAMPVG